MKLLLRKRIGSRALRQRGWKHSALFRPLGEVLEPRALLTTSSPVASYEMVSTDWFAQSPTTPVGSSQTFIGPIAVAIGGSSSDWQSTADVAQWIVRLTPQAAQQAGSVAGASAELDL